MPQDGGISRILEGRDPFGMPVGKSLGLHVLAVGAIALSAWLHGRFHGSEWGQNYAQGAVQATLVSSAPSIPLPQTQKATQNVLATENPSPAPVIEKQQTLPAPDLQAIPIPVKQPPRPRPLPPRPQPEQKHPQPATPPQQNRANYGEQAPSSMPKATTTSSTASAAQVTVSGSDFGSRFPWYVDIIKRKTAQNWYAQEVDPGTAAGHRVYVEFTLSRDGAPGQVRVAQSSGSPTLDTSCVRAVQRVDSYGPLPPGYNGSSLSVSYYCERPSR